MRESGIHAPHKRRYKVTTDSKDVGIILFAADDPFKSELTLGTLGATVFACQTRTKTPFAHLNQLGSKRLRGKQAYRMTKDRENIDSAELASFRRLAKAYAVLQAAQVAQMLNNKSLLEICHEKTT